MKEDEITAENRSIEPLRRTALAFSVRDAETYALAAETCKGVKAQIDRREGVRKHLAAPILEAKKRLDDLFRPGTEALKAIESHLKREMGEHTARQERARAEAMRAALPLDAPEVPREEGVGVSHSWVPVVVLDSAVPREYCSADVTKLATLAEGRGIHEKPHAVPGVVWELRSSVRVRR